MNEPICDTKDLADYFNAMTERRRILTEVETLKAEIDRLKGKIEDWKSWGIVEIAVRNPRVAEYMNHWEGRALKAEEELSKLRQQEIDTFPCPCCQWPMSPQMLNLNLICPCCGFEPECDGGDVDFYRASWDGQWWFKEEPKPALVVNLEAELTKLRQKCQGEKCVCGHFSCAHNDGLYRGVPTCADCGCLGFTQESS